MTAAVQTVTYLANHAEVLRKARELGEKLRHDTVVTYASEGETVRTMVDLVEGYTQREDDLVGSFQTCDVVITAILDKLEHGAKFEDNSRFFNDLDAIRYLARNMVKLVKQPEEYKKQTNFVKKSTNAD